MFRSDLRGAERRAAVQAAHTRVTLTRENRVRELARLSEYTHSAPVSLVSAFHRNPALSAHELRHVAAQNEVLKAGSRSTNGPARAETSACEEPTRAKNRTEGSSPDRYSRINVTNPQFRLARWRVAVWQHNGQIRIRPGQ